MKLNTDNAQTMPVTDAVYHPPKRRKADSDYSPRGHLFRVQWPTSVLDALSGMGGSRTRRQAARRHQEERSG